MATVSISGRITGSLRAPGRITKCTGKEHLNGRMEGNIKVDMFMIKNTVRELSLGHLGNSTKANGSTESSTELVTLLTPRIRNEKENG